MSSLDRFLAANSGVLSYSALDAAGIPREQVRAAVRTGAVTRIRRGWYAAPSANRDVIRAVRVGGVATAATVARLHGLWLLDDARLHVRVPASTGRLKAPDDRSAVLDRGRHAVCVHYSRRGPFHRARDPLTIALAEMFACTGAPSALMSIDSALRKGELQLGHLDRIGEWMPRTRRHLLDRVDADSESGIETIIRLLLRSRRIPHRIQVDVVGDGTRVDFLVGERLVIEADGREFHTGDAFEEDRRRDFELIARGYLVLRLSYRQIVHDWERTQAGILAIVERGEHRWAGRPRLGPYPGVPLATSTPPG